jgi:hypothetical protein
MATGYQTPREGQAALTGNHTVWLKFPDGLWYSPKDVSGIDRTIETKRHVVALRGKYGRIARLPQTRKRR